MARRNDRGPTTKRSTPVSLAPLTLKEAIGGLFAIPDPDATKPKHGKAPPTPDEE